MAGENKFIKAKNLNFAQTVPQLIDMNVSKVPAYGGDPLAKSVGDTIYKFAENAKKVAQAGELTRLKTELSELDNQFKVNFLANPNAFNTDEGRKAVADAYNNVVAQKKAILQNGKMALSSDDYSSLDQFFRQGTSNAIFNTQKEINTAYTKEEVDTQMFTAQASLENIKNLDDPTMQNELVTDTLKSLGSLKQLGVDTRKIQLDFAVKAQKELNEVTIQRNIIDNFSNPRYFKKDSKGNIEWADPPYNTVPKIDIFAKNRDLMALEKTFLSDEAIREASKGIAEVTGIDETTAFNYVKNQRQGDWIKGSIKMKADLDHQQQLEEAKAFRYEERKRQEVFEKRMALNSASTPEAIRMFSQDSDPIAIQLNRVNPNTNTTLMHDITGGIADNLADLQSKGYNMYLLDQPVVKNIRDGLTTSLQSEDDFKNFIRGQKVDYFDPNKYTPQDRLAYAQQIADGYSDDFMTPKLILDAMDGDQDAIRRAVTMRNAPPVNLQAGYNAKAQDFYTGNRVADTTLLTDILANPDVYGIDIPTTITTVEERSAFVLNKYRREDTVKERIDQQRVKILQQSQKKPLAVYTPPTHSGTIINEVVTNNVRQSYTKEHLTEIAGKKAPKDQYEKERARLRNNIVEDDALLYGQKNAVKEQIKAGTWTIDTINKAPVGERNNLPIMRALNQYDNLGNVNPYFDPDIYNGLKKDFMNGYKSGKYGIKDIPDFLQYDPDIENMEY